MKRQETIDIENLLIKQTKEKRIYGCEEVTIGFANNGHGNEICDFISMDSKGIIKCYEIKVTMADLKSNAKMSWYGNYNYLIIGGELVDKLDEVIKLTPKHIGIMIGLKSIRKSTKQNITTKQQIMLKDSLIRSIYYKLEKHRNADNINVIRGYKSKIIKLERELKEYRDKYWELKNLEYERRQLIDVIPKQK